MRSLTDLMARVDWTQMRLNDLGLVRSGGDCLLQMLYGGFGYESRARQQGYSQKQIDTIEKDSTLRSSAQPSSPLDPEENG